MTSSWRESGKEADIFVMNRVSADDISSLGAAIYKDIIADKIMKI